MTTGVEQGDSRITAEACSWFAQLETGDLSRQDLAAFREWINRSPRHAAELREIATLSADLSILTELIEPLSASRGRRAVQRSRRSFVLKAAAACALLAVTGVTSYVYFHEDTFRADYVTEIGAYRTVELPDGSLIKLNTNSAVEAVLNDEVREVRLIRGEAYFEVAKNPSRPFVVYAGDHSARAIGTAFVVRLLNDETTLIVAEGVVAFSKSSPELASAPRAAVHDGSASTQRNDLPLIVEAGYETSSQALERRPEARRLSAHMQKRKLSWTEGLFDFSDTPLVDVVEEVGRHTTTRIVIADAELKEVRFGGLFRIGDVETLLDALPTVGVAVERVDENTVVLRRLDEG